MLKQSLKISLRRLLKFKAQTLINVTGLGIAMAENLTGRGADASHSQKRPAG